MLGPKGEGVVLLQGPLLQDELKLFRVLCHVYKGDVVEQQRDDDFPRLRLLHGHGSVRDAHPPGRLGTCVGEPPLDDQDLAPARAVLEAAAQGCEPFIFGCLCGGGQQQVLSPVRLALLPAFLFALVGVKDLEREPRRPNVFDRADVLFCVRVDARPAVRLVVPLVKLKKVARHFLEFVNLIATMPSRHSGDQARKVDLLPHCTKKGAER